MAIGCELDAVVKTRSQVVHEHLRVVRIAPADEPIADELGVGTNRGPCPNVAGESGRVLGDILLFGVNEAPNLVALDPRAVQAAHVLVMEVDAGFPGFRKELRHRID